MPEISMARTLISQALADFAMIARTDGYHPGEVFYVERHFLYSQLEPDTARLSVTDNGRFIFKGEPCNI